MRFSKKTLSAFLALVWLAVGLSLSFAAYRYLSSSSSTMPWLLGLSSSAVLLGLAKGQFVLAKAARKTLASLVKEKEPAPLTAAIGPKFLLLIACMMGLAKLIRFFGAGPELLGFIDLTVGVALIRGALVYAMATCDKLSLS